MGMMEENMETTFQVLRLPTNRGPFLESHDRDYNISGSILGSPNLWEFPIKPLTVQGDERCLR